MKIESNKNWTTCLRLNTGDGSPRVFLLNSHFLGSVPKKGGLLMVGFMNPWIYMYDADVVWDQPDEELLLKFSIPFNSKELEEQGKITINPEYGYEFSHTLETQIRGQLKNGLAMIDFYESCDKRHRLSRYGNDYIATLCMKL